MIDHQKAVGPDSWESRLQFLAHAGEILSEDLDHGATLRRLLRLLVPPMADWCAGFLVEGRELRALTAAHVDPDLQPLVDQMAALARWTLPLPANAQNPMLRAVHSGELQLDSEVPDRRLQAMAHDDKHYHMLRRLDP